MYASERVDYWRRLVKHRYRSEAECVSALIRQASLSITQREEIVAHAASLVEAVRHSDTTNLIEKFLSEYGLSSQEGIALMCLAEALLRVPDGETVDALIEDKIASADWGKHIAHSTSPLVNASTWALMITGKVLKTNDSRPLIAVREVVKRLGEPVIRGMVNAAMRAMGKQFVLGETIEYALQNVRDSYTCSYDMLGEAARTEAEAWRYFRSYSDAIRQLAVHSYSEDFRDNPGISVKLSALHPRFEYSQKRRVLEELPSKLRSLSYMAKSSNIGLCVDAEEADRTELTLEVVEHVISDPGLAGWDGFGIAVQAYTRRATDVLGWFFALARDLDRRFTVRLVKGAYWDTEIKRAQVQGLADYPVFTRKASTDISYIANVRTLVQMRERIYSQFATHNAHSVSAVLKLGAPRESFEFQRLHGMGETLHEIVREQEGTRCRIYAPVGTHRDLLAYLVRRLLENGANSSFVNQMVDADVPSREIAADPISHMGILTGNVRSSNLPLPKDLYSPTRVNSEGWDLSDTRVLERLRLRTNDEGSPRIARSVIAVDTTSLMDSEALYNPARCDDCIGSWVPASEAEVILAARLARPWSEALEQRTAILERVADLYEEHHPELFSLLTLEAGKTLVDCVGEVREAVDFLRYYASEISARQPQPVRGIFACISPWNFPLAIFTGQVAAALATGNGVVAKPSEFTPLIAHRAVQLMHEAGVPRESLQLLLGRGSEIGPTLTQSRHIDGVCFTGSSETARSINRNMAANLRFGAPLIAETGGLNAMIVDSTALLEQAVQDVLTSAFQSAGQRCSALRVLYIQSDISDDFIGMLSGAMEELTVADPSHETRWDLSCDVGPVIHRDAQLEIQEYVDSARSEGRLIRQLETPEGGFFVGPGVVEISSIAELSRETFGPVLHLIRFDREEIPRIVAEINATGYGLTFGVHTRIDDRVQYLVDRIRAGNIYVNRNQIGAVVGSQPFGGGGLSGTGPKAGGPHYPDQFVRWPDELVADDGSSSPPSISSRLIDAHMLNESVGRVRKTLNDGALTDRFLPGPTGEMNHYLIHARGVIVCIGQRASHAFRQIGSVVKYGCRAIIICPEQLHLHGIYPEVSEVFQGRIEPDVLTTIVGIDAVCFQGCEEEGRALRIALARRRGRIIPLSDEPGNPCLFIIERHLSVDTTASGGNAALLSSS